MDIQLLCESRGSEILIYSSWHGVSNILGSLRLQFLFLLLLFLLLWLLPLTVSLLLYSTAVVSTAFYDTSYYYFWGFLSVPVMDSGSHLGSVTIGLKASGFFNGPVIITVCQWSLYLCHSHGSALLHFCSLCWHHYQHFFLVTCLVFSVKAGRKQPIVRGYLLGANITNQVDSQHRNMPPIWLPKWTQ